ncbi:hypothetical protein OJ996_11140 [Luteolibacter sp. GHJ8]|uniref:HEAT repeat domain-containing protein n=1 Tax=Luteolibacter rhizosphaerae TaxID=2989719 RepID=A0ABT3G2R3_9BACT|nr:hypothetical protein [Luteolibacter rhizosphaerae]MCW1914134.1 hypothetical protein [Luteolibacter rhizosphaerae]
MLSRKKLLLLSAGILVAATWIGYRAECRVMDSAGNKPLTVQSVVRRVTAPKERRQTLDRINEIRHLVGRLEASPREAAEAWEIIRALGIEDVQACLAEIPQKPQRHVNAMITQMLFQRWGQLDPQAAAEVASKPPYDQDYSVMLAIGISWAERDVEAALRWGKSQPDNTAQNMIGLTAGRLLVRQDPEKALSRALAEFPFATHGVISGLVSETANKEEARRKVVTELAALEEKRYLRSYLSQLGWFVDDKPEVLTALVKDLEQAGLPEAELKEFTQRMEQRVRHGDWERSITNTFGPDSTASAEEKQRLFSNWATNQPDKALAWAKKQGNLETLAESVRRNSNNLLRSNWQPASTPSMNPWEKGIVDQFQAWRERDTSAADQWLQTMPSDIRQHLSQDHATH